MFFQNFEKLSKDKSKTTTAVGQELGISKSTVSYWRNNENAIPKQEQLILIADYFGVSVDYLLGNTQQKKPATDMTGDEQYAEIIKKVMSLKNDSDLQRAGDFLDGLLAARENPEK